MSLSSLSVWEADELDATLSNLMMVASSGSDPFTSMLWLNKVASSVAKSLKLPTPYFTDPLPALIWLTAARLRMDIPRAA